MTTLKTDTIKWGGSLTNEIVGKLLLYASEVDGTYYYNTILKFIQGCPAQEAIDSILNEMLEILNDTGIERL